MNSTNRADGMKGTSGTSPAAPDTGTGASMSHHAAQKAITRMFVGTVGEKRAAAVHVHMARCAACASLYHRHRQLEMALAGRAASFAKPSVFSRERVEAAVFGALAQQRQQEPHRWRRLALGALAPALAAAAVLLLLSRAPDERTTLSPSGALAPVVVHDQLTARGPKGSSPSGAEAPATAVGVRLFRVAAASRPATTAPRVVAEATSLSRDDILAFTYTNDTTTLHYLMLFGIQPHGAVHWYYPADSDNDSISIPIATGLVDEPLDEGIRLAARHAEGEVRIIALFSRTPLHRQAVAERLASAAMHSSLAVLATEVDPEAGVLAYSCSVEITASHGAHERAPRGMRATPPHEDL